MDDSTKPYSRFNRPNTIYEEARRSTGGSDALGDLDSDNSSSSVGTASTGDPGEGAAFPPTYLVLAFARHVKPEALRWLVDKIRGKRRDGGAELFVRRQPLRHGEGVTLHLSASKIKFLEVAEELELRKRDSAGLMREFLVSQLEDFLVDGMHVDDLLTTADRQAIVRHELENIRALPGDSCVPGYPHHRLYEGQSIVQVCLHWGILERLYPLHDHEELDRLGKQWYRSIFQQQPFEDIRLYFGDSVALYFNFVSFYTTALLAPMALGFLQLFLSYETLAFFCLFNVIWVTVFLEMWKRRCSELAFSWGTIDMTSLDEPRANFRGQMALDPITGRMQPQFPRWKTNLRMYCVSLPIVALCMAGAFVVMLCSFWAEDWVMGVHREHGLPHPEVLILLPSVVYTALVFVMNAYYRRLATYLTEWENHRTQSQFERHRVTKLVLFEFVNNFMSLFYIAYYIQDMDLLKYQVAVMLIILQTINHFQECFLPLIMKYGGSKISSLLYGDELATPQSMKKVTPAKASEFAAVSELLHDVPELDPEDPRIQQAREEGLMEPYEGTYDDYLEMFVQFGYVFLFSSAYPIAAFWAVFNNVIEIRADAFKLCRVYQRPMARRVKDIGAWQRAFEAVGAMSVMTNCGLLSLSPQLRGLAPELSSVEWLLVFVVLEHALLAVRYVLHQVIPERPMSVRVALARLNYLSKQALKHERMLKTRRHALTRKYRTIHGPHNRSQQ